jgi:hypothetical protein
MIDTDLAFNGYHAAVVLGLAAGVALSFALSMWGL